MDEVRKSTLFRSLATQHPDVDVWADPDYTEGGWSYFWIVSKFDASSVRNLAYVRVQGRQLERRTYNDEGDDLWVSEG